MKRLTYLGVTHVVADAASRVAGARVPVPVERFKYSKQGASSADTVCGRLLLVGSFWTKHPFEGCAYLPDGAHWKAVHTFKVS